MNSRMNVAFFLLSVTVAVSHAENVIPSAPTATADLAPCWWDGGVTPPTPPHPFPVPPAPPRYPLPEPPAPPRYPLPEPPTPPQAPEPRRYDYLEMAEQFCPNLKETRDGNSLSVEYSWAELAPSNSIGFQFVNDGNVTGQMTNFNLGSLPCHNVLSKHYRASGISISAAGVKVHYLPGNSLNR